MVQGAKSLSHRVRHLVCLLGSVIFVWLVYRRIEWQSLAGELHHIKHGWIAGGTALFGLAIWLGALRWHLMLAMKSLSVSRWASFQATMTGHFFNTLMLGPLGGDIAKSAYYGRRHHLPIPDILASCWLDRLVAALGSLVFALAIILGISGMNVVKLNARLPAFQIIVIGILAGGSLAGLTGYGFYRFWPDSPAIRAIRSLWTGLHNLRNSPYRVVGAVLLGFMVQLCLSSILAFSLQAVSTSPIPWTGLFWTFPIISLLTSLPLSINGLGVREGASLVLLGQFGISATDAVAASMLTLAVNMLWAAIGGATLWLSCRQCLPRSQQPG